MSTNSASFTRFFSLKGKEENQQAKAAVRRLYPVRQRLASTHIFLFQILLLLCLGKQALKKNKKCQKCSNGDLRPPGGKRPLEGDECLYGSLY